MEREAAGKKPKKGLFSKWMKPKKKEWWDMYEDSSESQAQNQEGISKKNQWDPNTFREGEYHYQYQPKEGEEGEVLFDVEAIRKEIRKAKARGL